MSKPNPAVDGYIRKNKEWSEELAALRAIITAFPLVEEIKWRTPCYSLDGANVLFIGSGKDHCLISFLKGVLLKDAKKILEFPGPNTQAAKVVRLRSLKEIQDLTPTLKAYVLEAIEVEKSGVKPPMKAITEHAVPEELQKKLDESPALNKAFRALTPGRQRAYFINISSAKQAKTREARVEKFIPRILEGKGLDDD